MKKYLKTFPNNTENTFEIPNTYLKIENIIGNLDPKLKKVFCFLIIHDTEHTFEILNTYLK